LPDGVVGGADVVGVEPAPPGVGVVVGLCVAGVGGGDEPAAIEAAPEVVWKLASSARPPAVLAMTGRARRIVLGGPQYAKRSK
jgi:hypothetical protein